MNSTLNVNSFENFVISICQIIFEQYKIQIKEKMYFTFVLSGGRTPKAVFEELVINYKEAINWSKVHLFWLDERCVSPSHKDSNYKLAHDNLIDKLDQPIGSIHRMKGELEPDLAAKEYERDLKLFFKNKEIRFDFVLLGMGDDGHVASIFPESNELNIKNKLVLATEKKYNGYYRITLGLEIINSSNFKLLMAKGENKVNKLESNEILYPINRITNKYIVKYT